MNIVYIHTHDSGRYIGPYGYRMETPNMMKLAEESTLFRQAFCAAPTCSPSRSALLTGTYPHSNGMIGLAHRGFQLKDYNKHLVSWLDKQGYETVLCGIQHEAVDGSIIGYDKVLLEPEDTNMYIENTEAFDLKGAHLASDYLLSRKNKQDKFFLSFGMINTHRDFPEDIKDIKPDYVMPPHVLYDCPETRRDMAAYIASAETADKCLGIVMEAIKDAGIEENTVVLFTTDHGIAFPYMKCNLYDTGIGVAMMLKYPNNPTRGKASDTLVSHVDIFPTLCDLCGIDKPDWLEGESMADIISGRKEDDPEKAIFAEINYHASYEPVRCIRTKRYKLIRRFDYHNSVVPSNIDNGISKQFIMKAGALDKVLEKEMLFDLYIDPMERENLVTNAAYKTIYDELSLRLYNWMERTEDPLLRNGYRIPAPEGALINKFTCLHAEYDDFENEQDV